jgi:phenylacetate-coenzyme A ligase PaaK-like adenylate-forming protein
MRNYLSFQELQSLSWERIEKIQNARFHAVAKNLLPHTKFYSNLFKEYNIDPHKLKKVEDWQTQGLPLVKKFYYMKHVEDFVVKPDHPFKTYWRYLRDLSFPEAVKFTVNSINTQAVSSRLHYFFHPKMPLFSGGTQSGRPIPTFITHPQLINLQNVTSITVQLMSKDLDMPTTGMNLFPYGPHLAWHAVQTAFNIGVELNLATAAGNAMRTEDLVKMADQFKANVFAGMSIYMVDKFLPMLIKKKVKLNEKAVFINGSEKMTYQDKQKLIKLAQKAGVRDVLVLDFYGASELKEGIMPECCPRSGFHHIAPLSNIIKTAKINNIPPGDKMVTDWEFSEGGAAAIWNIGGSGTVLGGYLLGDKYEKIVKGKCPNCGLNTERIIGIDRLELKK